MKLELSFFFFEGSRGIWIYISKFRVALKIFAYVVSKILENHTKTK
jgi:hypothetical protein